MAKYNFVFLGQHGAFEHVDVEVFRNDVSVGTVRIALGDKPNETAKEDVLDFCQDLLESLKIQRDQGLITNQEAKTQFEAFELWR